MMNDATLEHPRKYIPLPRPNTSNKVYDSNDKNIFKNSWIQTVNWITNKIESSVVCHSRHILKISSKAINNILIILQTEKEIHTDRQKYHLLG